MEARFKSRLYYKYLLSYVLILSVPLLVIGLFVYNHFLQTLKSEVIDNNLNMLSQVKEIVDVKFNELEKIAYQISRNPELTPYMATRNAVKGMNTIKELRNYTAGNSFAHEIFLHYRKQPYLYSSISTYTASNFIDAIYRYEHWTQEEFERAIDSLNGPALRPAEYVGGSDGERLITYMVPIPLRDEVPYGTVMFMIKESSITNLIRNILRDYGGNTVIFDRSGQQVTYMEGEHGFETGKLVEMIDRTRERGSTTVGIGGNDYFISHIQSSETGWVYVTKVEKSRVMASVARIKLFALAGLAATILFGGLAIFILMHINYKPIRRLKQLTEALTGRKPVGPREDELESIGLAVRQMSENTKELGLEIMKSRPALKQYMLMNLLKGRIRHIEEFNSSGRSCGIGFSGNWFHAAVLLIDPGGAAGPKPVKEAIIASLEAACRASGRIEGYGLDSMDGNRFLFIFGMADPDGTALSQLLRSFRDTAGTEWACPVTIGLGTGYSGIGDIGKSYLEASTAADYRLIKGKDKVIDFREVAQTEHHGYSDKELIELELYLKQGNMDKIKLCLDAVVRKIQHPDTSLFTARSICYDLIHTIIRPVFELNLPAGTDKLPDVWSLLRFETVDELADMVKEASVDICGIIQNNKESRNFALKDQLIAYMERHYADHDFSLQTMAEAFSLSAPYVSRYFKDQAGMTVSQYLNTIRIGAAKNMLENGEDNLSDLIGRIGYVNTSSFIRKFKETEGMTPGEYRRMYCQGQQRDAK
ncbi:helix-turn-helix domain-containing protein [Paenibacillus oceani]|uniref:AraC family transcriptional regulator n=1 Tax=Paenibacillus oceani TaxID=2772510 RepID=A0A927C7H6_9BACL|nr:helix-turn-helix domain-containing protein [Paenibacillus oceani]MBD2861563.1 AraC family transcriptional regulator [Paenibacillus oceani]